MKLWPFCVERRIDTRREAYLEARFLVCDGFSGKRLSRSCPAQVLNFSLRGCCLALGRLDCGGFHLHRCLEAPQDYILQLSIDPRNGDARQYTAELRWINRELDDHAMPFRAGLEFIQQQSH
ncbi:MAG: hypothetical protein KQI62_08695 [Deltaproteobacteria bacterium]|nr:hypothetical protein [Deltaproteobacteria bacterium]